MNRSRTSNSGPWAAGAAKIPLIVIVSAPSGAGKTTLCHRLIAESGGRSVFSVSCTTRAPRPGEVEGREYWFLEESEFLLRAQRGEFLEYARVHDHYYGTLKRTVADHLAAGRDVYLDIDVQGAKQIRAVAALPMDNGRILPIEAFVCPVFLLPPSMEVLERRLRDRALDSEEVVRRRMTNALDELKHWDQYDYIVVNDDLDRAVAEVQGILSVERRRVSRFLALHGAAGD